MAKERILVIDDEPQIVSLCSRILEREDYVVITPEFGEEAFAFAEEGEYDLLLSDIRMPGLNGIDLFRRVRAAGQEVPCVFITGHATVDTVIEALKEGVEGFVQKPFTSGELLLAVDQAFEKSRLANENQRLKALMPLLELNKILLDEIEQESFFQNALAIVTTKLQADRVSLIVRDEGNEEILTFAAATGLPEQYQVPRNTRTNGGIAGYVFRSGERLLLNDSHEDPMILEAMQKNDITSGLCVPLRTGNRSMGVMCASRLGREDRFDRSDLDLFSLLSAQIAASVENLRLYRALRGSYMKTIEALASAIEAKDSYTKGHSTQVALYAAAIGREMGLSRPVVEDLRVAGLLHDVGKIGIPETVLLKPGRLSSLEYEIMKTHPFYAHKIIEPIGLPSEVSRAIRHHHERFDGKGYPDGLQGEDVPMGARILHVADSLEAMTSDRPYRSMLSWAQIEKELVNNAGTQFDPDVVEVCLRLAKKGALLHPEHPSRYISSTPQPLEEQPLSHPRPLGVRGLPPSPRPGFPLDS